MPEKPVERNAIWLWLVALVGEHFPMLPPLAICHIDNICHMYSTMSLMLQNDMPQEARMRVNENGRVVIPASFRKALGINVGDEVVLRIEDDELRISTLKKRIEWAQRLVRKHAKPGVSVVDELIAERREAAKRE